MAREVDARLRDAAKFGDVNDVTLAIADGADPDAFRGTSNYTPLQWAARRNLVAAIVALIAAGAHVDCPSCNGSTPLTTAAWSGHTAAIEALLGAGADVNRAKHNGDTALAEASAWGQLGVARSLLEAGARAEQQNKSGKTSVDLVREHVPAAVGTVPRSPRPHAQACAANNSGRKAEMLTLLNSRTAWTRRRPVTVACYSCDWEWEHDA
jgi:ankyrin repeat protein